uniref:NUBPL iron-transfer P-loop NTPase n=1 Tax=Candidatus Kentrum sp. FW TaxID=2126338 RepID=A0A450T2A9_9GAMM|nr:MAG: NUBPL iron-transfer P-loop NTPase [Candidatus Kentron sp. FW]
MEIPGIGPILINRDLNGRVRLIMDSRCENDDQAKITLDAIAREMQKELGSHAYLIERAFLFEPDIKEELRREITFPLDGVDGVHVVDRLVTESNWSSIAEPDPNAVPRIVFFSIKGGVGRSTALAVVAMGLVEQGKRVLVLDLDLESPGLSSSLLPEDRRPMHGIADWLVKDLVDNGASVFESMVVTSTLPGTGEIFVVPAHGRTRASTLPSWDGFGCRR